MKKYFLLVAFICCVCSGFSFEYHDFEESGIYYIWDQEEFYEQAEAVFLSSFGDLYRQLDVPNYPQRLLNAIQEERELAKSNTIHWLVAMENDQVIGMCIFESANGATVYIRQLAVLPKCQYRGIGKQLVFSLLSPELEKISIVTPYFNHVAIGFYQRLGFKMTEFQHAGYDPNIYVGMEWLNLMCTGRCMRKDSRASWPLGQRGDGDKGSRSLH